MAGVSGCKGGNEELVDEGQKRLKGVRRTAGGRCSRKGGGGEIWMGCVARCRFPILQAFSPPLFSFVSNRFCFKLKFILGLGVDFFFVMRTRAARVTCVCACDGHEPMLLLLLLLLLLGSSFSCKCLHIFTRQQGGQRYIHCSLPLLLLYAPPPNPCAPRRFCKKTPPPMPAPTLPSCHVSQQVLRRACGCGPSRQLVLALP